MRLKGKKVLVTGADGFIGSHLVEALLDAGCNVRAFVYYNSFNSWGWLDTFQKQKLKNIDIFTGDIRDHNGVKRSMEGVDTVFHLAALIGIPFSYHSPDCYVDTNIKGVLNILQAARELKTRRILATSTSEVYGTAQYTPIDESHPLQGQSPYSATKIAADKITESFFRSFNVPTTIARPFNTYGPRQSARAIIPTIITQLLDGKKEVKLGSLTPARDFNFVKDICNGFLAIAASEKTIGEEINIASSRAVSIGELVNRLIKKINPNAKVAFDRKRTRPKNSEVEKLLGCKKKITRLTGWKPKYSLDKGLDETVEWFKSGGHLKRYKPDIYNV